MPEQAGPWVAAVQAQQSLLASQHDNATDADRALVDALASAHANARESLRRLDAIAEQLERAVGHGSALAVDTPLGAREFQRFLLAKQREIAAVVADARELSRTKKAALDTLRAQYGGEAGQ
ncbi:hypothetical protein A5714_01385 [Mycobacterium sp. E2462]|uniref:DUF4226 domain-containing protein n=1 Tax=Mycobacterium sp. E2462 TaxID=1834133 RepID=UPI0007FC0598|nr:DUF4226 domain-containing protein [Mycobacterium sp. E2462]OBI14555.1 hypothetical protein A5714_01385 [Mycobacterium sp. E2462]